MTWVAWILCGWGAWASVAPVSTDNDKNNVYSLELQALDSYGESAQLHLKSYLLDVAHHDQAAMAHECEELGADLGRLQFFVQDWTTLPDSYTGAGNTVLSKESFARDFATVSKAIPHLQERHKECSSAIQTE
jgi:hypothetical protein